MALVGSMLVALVACRAPPPISRGPNESVAPHPLVAWRLRCPDAGETRASPPFTLAAECAARAELPALAHDRGLAVEIESDEVLQRLLLVRARADGRRLAPIPFAARESDTRVTMSTGPLAIEHAVETAVVLYNAEDRPLTVRAATWTQALPVPMHEVGSIIRLEHHTELDVARGESLAELWLPLPVAHGGQVPLDVRVRLDPADVGELVLVRDGPVNWGAVARFAPAVEHRRVVFSWTAVVLVRDVLPDERISTEDARARRWLAPSVIVEADDPNAREIARALSDHGTRDPAARVEALRAWLEALGPPTSEAGSQRASDVIASGGRANCTGSANLAAALGRALGIPSRHLAGVVTDDRLQTHSVVELLVGDPPAWLRIEPQDGSVVADDDMVVLRVVDPADEGAAAIDARRWGAPGVPMRALVEVLRGGERLTERLETDRFPGCSRCDNAATRVATLVDTSMTRMRRVHERARRAWKRDLAAALQSTASDAIERGDVDARAIGSLDDLERFVAANE